MIRPKEKLRERGIINAERIADNLELQTPAIQENNALLESSKEYWETAEDQAERTEFLHIIRMRDMQQLRQQMFEVDSRGAPFRRLTSTGTASSISSQEAASQSGQPLVQTSIHKLHKM